MKKIIIIQTAFLGDLLLTTPLIKIIKNKFSHSEITLVCRKGFGDFFRKIGLSDEVVEVDKSSRENYKRVLRQLELLEYDLLLCPHQSMRSAFMAKRINAKLKIGFKSWWNSKFFTKRFYRDKLLPDALRQITLFQDYAPEIKEGIVDYKKKEPSRIVMDSFNDHYIIPEIFSMSLDIESILTFDSNGIFNKFGIKENSIIISPGSVWETKQWTKEGYASLARSLSKEHSVVLVGTSSERVLCEEIAEMASNVSNLSGRTTLFELLVILSKSKALICNDSGSMHMASLVNLPTLAIFGPTVLNYGYRPWQNKALVVENKNMKYRPCGSHGHHKCPMRTHECMESVGVHHVISQMNKLTSLSQ